MSTEDLHGWQANVSGEDYVSWGLRLYVGIRGGDVHQYVKAIRSDGVEYELVAPMAGDAPSIVMPIDMARALLDALADHFGQSGSGRQLRADYSHERGRVDKLLDVLSTVATGGRP